jgi:hypothetical protein
MKCDEEWKGKYFSKATEGTMHPLQLNSPLLFKHMSPDPIDLR